MEPNVGAMCFADGKRCYKLRNWQIEKIDSSMKSLEGLTLPKLWF